ncbi:MAG: hypothetical protein ACTSRU_19095 [Candidatus Hodarchaeales archaeon]
MASTFVKEQLESIGIDLSSRESTVLKAILMIEKKKETSSFDNIRKLLDQSLKKKLSRQWIYKCLSNLEEKGFIKVDVVATPKIYRTSSDLIKHVIEREISIAKEKLSSDEKEITKNIEVLEEQDMRLVTSYLIGMMRKSVKTSEVKVLESNPQVREAIRDMCSNVAEGDILRISEKANLLQLETRDSSEEENAIMLAVQTEGLKIRSLIELPKTRTDEFPKIFLDYFGKQLPLLKDVMQSGKLQVRVNKSKRFPHKMLCYNREKLLLTMSEIDYRPSQAIYLSREDNTWLVDNTVDTFDKLWEDAVDLRVIFKEFEEGLA